MRLLAVLFLLGLPGRLLAQSAATPLSPDSLQTWQPRPPTADTLRLKQLINHSYQLMATNLDSAQLLAQAAVSLAWRRGQGIGLVYGLSALAAAQYYASQYPAAQRNYELLLWAARRTGRTERIGAAYMGLGLVALDLYDSRGAEQYFRRAQQAFATAKPRNRADELSAMLNRAYNYLDLDSVGRARQLVKEALTQLPHVPEARHPAKYWGLLGLVQKKAGQFDSAAATYRYALSLARTTHDLNPEAEAQLGLAELALRRADYPGALREASQAERLFHQLGDEQEGEALRHQAVALTFLRRPEAPATLRRYLAFSDSLQIAQRLDEVAAAQARFEVTEQQARVRELEQQRRFTALQATQVQFRNRVGLVALGGAALLLLGLGLWAYRRRQVARESALRTRIAADLHDDVGSLLTQISLETELLRDGLYTPAEQPRQLYRLADASRTAVRHMNDVVWGLDARHDSMADLLDRLRDHAAEVLTPTGLEAHFAVGPDVEASALPLPSRQALYLIYKEALHNVVKHAHGATQAQVSLQRAPGALLLTVADNGRPAPTPRPGTGHGLSNMARRAAEAGGTLRSGPAAEGGWQVEARLPLE